MSTAEATDGFDPATSPITAENLIGRTFVGEHRGVFSQDFYGEKTIIGLGEHSQGIYLVVEDSDHEIHVAGGLDEAHIREILTPDPNLIDWK